MNRKETEYFNSYLVKPSDAPDIEDNNLLARYKFTTPFIPETEQSEWEVAVVSMSLSGGYIPLMLWNDLFYVGIYWSGTLYSAQAQIPAPDNIFAEGDEVVYPQQICVAFNTAISDASTQAVIAGATISEAPKMVFDPDDGLFKVITNIVDFVDTTPKPIIAFNRPWYNIILTSMRTFVNAQVQSFESVSGLVNDYQCQLIVEETYKNRIEAVSTGIVNATGAYYVNSQQWPTPNSIYGVHSIRLLSSLSPFNGEYLISDSTAWIDRGQGTQNLATEKILTDLVTTVDGWDNIRGKITYFPYNLLWHEITGSNLNELEIRFVWISNDGITRNIQIPTSTIASCKLAFRRKGAYSIVKHLDYFLKHSDLVVSRDE